MAGIFINYRRDDTPGVAGRLFDYLATKYSRGDLFMDVDAMRPGMDFAKQLDTQVSQCRVLLYERLSKRAASNSSGCCRFSPIQQSRWI